MKPLNKFLNYTHSFSEKTRKTFAAIGVAVFAFVIFGLLMGNVASRLSNISFSNLAVNQATERRAAENPNAAALGPAAGILESVKSLRFVTPEINSQNPFAGIEMNDLYDSYNRTEKSAKKILGAIQESVYGWAEKIGGMMYTP